MEVIAGYASRAWALKTVGASTQWLCKIESSVDSVADLDNARINQDIHFPRLN